MTDPLKFIDVGSLYSNEEIYRTLGVGNAGGIRVKHRSDDSIQRIVIMTSLPDTKSLVENPYHDRIEGDVLVYTGTGRIGDQSSLGPNAKLFRQRLERFPIWGFQQQSSRRDKSTGSRRWKCLGLLQCLRAYTESQVDSSGGTRSACVFEFRLWDQPRTIRVALDQEFFENICRKADVAIQCDDEESEVEFRDSVSEPRSDEIAALEETRRMLLVQQPRAFEVLIGELLVRCGLRDVEVTRYSQDGGIDIVARAPATIWPMQHLLVQVQAKRWLHTVGRREVAELRGSILPYAVGCIVTTSHYSRAAITESCSLGKTPITLVNGHELARLVREYPVTNLGR